MSAPPSGRDRQFADSQALAHVGSWEWRTWQTRIWWSDELCRIYGREPGFSPTPAEGMEMVHPEDRERLTAVVTDSQAGDFHYRIVRLDGAVRHVHGRREVRRDAAGTVTAHYGTVQDVTSRREAELQRDAALGLLESAFASSAVGLSLVDVDGRWLRVNGALCRMTGWSESELLSGRFQDITHPEDLQADLDLVARTLAGEIDDYQMEKRYLRRGGGEIWVLLSVSLVRDRDGEPLHFVGQVQDISQRKLAEDRLREAEAAARRERDHAQTIITAMHEGYALTIDDGITAVNDAWCELVGYSEDELFGMRPPYAFWPEERRDALNAERMRIRAAGGGTFETVFIRRDGTPFDAEVTARAARDGDGEVIGFVNTLRDVSDRNRLQRELERRARTDSLTGLPNRWVLRETLAHESRRHARDQTLALVVLDLDEFKQINDVHGHPVGDAVLTDVAQRLSSVVRGGEVLARVGGEEFAWLLPDCDGAGASSAAERARAVVADTPFDVVGALTMSAGIGVASIPCSDEEIYALADQALYDAKQGGRDRACTRAKLREPDERSGGGPGGPGRRFGPGSRGYLDLLTGATEWHAERHAGDARARGSAPNGRDPVVHEAQLVDHRLGEAERIEVD